MIVRNDECCSGDNFKVDVEPCCDRWSVGRRLIDSATGFHSASNGLTICGLGGGGLKK